MSRRQNHFQTISQLLLRAQHSVQTTLGTQRGCHRYPKTGEALHMIRFLHDIPENCRSVLSLMMAIYLLIHYPAVDSVCLTE